MIYTKFRFLKSALISVITGTLLVGQTTLSVRAESAEGLPGRRVGGGSRGCQELQQSPTIVPKQLIALMPETSLGKTATDSPTFFFRLPQFTAPKLVEFVLQDEQEQPIYSTTFQSPNQSGVIPISLPADGIPRLVMGKQYHWYLSVICDPRDRAKDVVVEGITQRTQLQAELAAQLQAASPTQQIELLAAQGFWQDALTALATLRRQHPQDATLTARWTKLLQSVELGTIAQEPLLPAPSLATAQQPGAAP